MGSVVFTTQRFSRDLVGDPPDGIYLVDFQAPVVSETVTYSTGPDAEGADLLRDKPENAHAICRLRVDRSQEDTEAEFEADLQALQALVGDANLGGASLTYTLPGQTREVECEVVTARITEAPTVNGVEWRRMRAEITLDIEVKPYGQLPLAAHDLTDSDPFGWDSITAGRYEFDTGALEVTNGKLVPSNTNNREFFAAFYRVEDFTATIKIRTGATLTDGLIGIGKRVDASNWIAGEYRVASGATLIRKEVAGSQSNESTGTAYALVADVNYWLRVTITGNDITVSLYSGAHPDEEGAILRSTDTHTMAGSVATAFGNGVFGDALIRFTPGDTDWWLDDWRLDAPVFECSEPVNAFEVRDVGGSAPALPELVFDEQDNRSRGSIEVGLGVHDVDDPAPVLIDSDMLEIAGYSGEQDSGITGAYNQAISGVAGDHIVATATPTAPVTVCSTGPLGGWGRHRIKARVYTDDTAPAGSVMVRVGWRRGNATIRYERWVTIPVVDQWFDAALAVVDVPDDTTEWTAYIQAVADTAAPVMVDYVTIQPAQRFARARAPISVEAADAFVARDEFALLEAALSGQTAPVGGDWAGDGDATDFVVDSEARAARSADSDTANTGRHVELDGDSTITDVVVSVDYQVDGDHSAATNQAFGGPTARANGDQDAAGAIIRDSGQLVSFGWRTGGGVWHFNADLIVSPALTSRCRIRLLTLSDGRWAIYLGSPDSLTLDRVLVGYEPRLVTAGALEEGRVGMYDEQRGGTTVTRLFDNFAAWIPVAGEVCAANGGVTLTHESMMLDDGAGPVPVFEGNYLKVPPGDSRLTVEARRFDSGDDWFDAGNEGDTFRLSLNLRERVLLT